MITFVFIFFVFRWVSSLAAQNGKNSWLYGILGIIVYYVSAWVFGFILKLLWVAGIFDYNTLTFTIIGVLAGILSVWIFRSILKSAWKKEALQSSNSELLDDGTDF